MFTDDFSAYAVGPCIGEGVQFGNWTVQWNGYGCVSIVNQNGVNALSLHPETSTLSEETHSALVTGPSYDGGVQFSCNVTTLQQLRQNSVPNPWEVGWVIWNYTDK